MTSSSVLHVVPVEGVNKPVYFSEEYFWEAMHFRPRDGDVFVVTYPKCGTTWMQFLVLNVLRWGEPLRMISDLLFASPYLDQEGQEAEERMMRPGAYKTHLPLHKMQWSDNAKYIYVARHPKDVCVSLFHHTTDRRAYQFDAPLDVFVRMFVAGDVDYGNYFDHLLPWYELKQKNTPNVLFTTYEEMSRDFDKVAMDVAGFVGGGRRQFLEENPDVLAKIRHNCSFQVMKDSLNELMSALQNSEDPEFIATLPRGRRYISSYVESLPKSEKNVQQARRGEMGTGKTELSKELNEVLDEFIKVRTENSSVMSLWETVNGNK